MPAPGWRPVWPGIVAHARGILALLAHGACDLPGMNCHYGTRSLRRCARRRIGLRVWRPSGADQALAATDVAAHPVETRRRRQGTLAGRRADGRCGRLPMPTGARGGVWANRFREYFLLGTDFFDSRTIARASPHPRAAPVMPSPIPCRRSAPAGIGAQRPDRSAPCVHRRSFHSVHARRKRWRASQGARLLLCQIVGPIKP